MVQVQTQSFVTAVFRYRLHADADCSYGVMHTIQVATQCSYCAHCTYIAYFTRHTQRMTTVLKQSLRTVVLLKK